MAFFLLGRSEDGGLSLLSDAAFESRQEALAELGRITADAAFDRWSDEVVLIDLDAGTPVLLVRPAETAATPSPDVESEAEEDSEAEADSESPDDPESAVFAALADQEPADEPDDDAAEVEPELVEAVEIDEVDETPSEPDEVPVEEPAAEDVAEADSEPKTAPQADEAVEPVEGADGMDSLRDAIARTTQHMEATGIVAPESIGPADDSVEEDAASQEAADADSGSDEPAPVPAPEPPAWPWATAPESEAVSEEVVTGEEQTETPFVLDGLEDPAIDAGGSLIMASIDDDELAANRAVILGAYGEEPDDELPAEPNVELASSDLSGEAQPSDAPDSPDEAVAEPESVPEPEEESDFIVLDLTPEEPEAPAIDDDDAASAGLDLDSIESTGSTPEPVSADADSEGEVPALSSYVCDDCVYVDTCPNKDQRRPEDCGSFQWK
jgi:hypothetical protein